MPKLIISCFLAVVACFFAACKSDRAPAPAHARNRPSVDLGSLEKRVADLKLKQPAQPSGEVADLKDKISQLETAGPGCRRSAKKAHRLREPASRRGTSSAATG